MNSVCNPPRAADLHRIRDLARAIRVFDVNVRAREEGYFVWGANLCDLPLVDPRGKPWALLTAGELEERKSWCMVPEQHDALRRELSKRVR